MYQRGDIISVPFPFTDLKISKPRPALVISNSKWVSHTGDVIIVMITSKEKNDSVTIPIRKEDLDFDLPKQSYIRCHRLATVEETIILGKIGEANDTLVQAVKAIIERIISDDVTMAQ